MVPTYLMIAVATILVKDMLYEHTSSGYKTNVLGYMDVRGRATPGIMLMYGFKLTRCY
jgi:hypothetical protein